MSARSATEIGAGLEPARPARPIPTAERIHVVGAGGAAGAAAALHAHHAGARVSGCDAGGPSPYTPPLEALAIPLAWAHAVDHVAAAGIARVDRLAVTKALTAVRPDHPELVAARRLGIPACSVQQLIADAAATRAQPLVGVAGTHGKSTTAGWVVEILVAAGLDPSAFVGALLPPGLTGGQGPSTVRIGHGRHFVVEADEYAGNFNPYRPAIAGLTTADWDHPDVFEDRAAVVRTFAAWIRQFDGGEEAAVLVANVGDAGVCEVVAELGGWNGMILPVLVVDAADNLEDAARRVVAQARDRHVPQAGDPRTGQPRALLGRWRVDPAGQGSLEIWGLDPAGSVGVALRLAGRHNAENGLVAAGTALAAGAAIPAILQGLASYAGVGRRLEVKGEVAGVVVIDDYGHHPTAMAATFAAVRQRYSGRRLWAVYEPLTYHRTAAMLDQFAAVLRRADRAVIAQIHAGRDPDTSIASAGILADAVCRDGGTPAWAPGSVEETGDWLATQVEPGDVVLVMGGGRSYVIADRLLAHLRERVATVDVPDPEAPPSA